MNNLFWGILITMTFWMTPAPQHSYGDLVWYAPGVMEATCQYRAEEAGVSYEEWMDGAIDGVALMSPADMGKTVYIYTRGRWEGPFRVCDCGMRGQVYEMVVSRGEVVEVGWRTAFRLGLGPHTGGWKIPVEVWVGEKPPTEYIRDPIDNERVRREPIDYVEWFLANVELVPCRVWLTDTLWVPCE